MFLVEVSYAEYAHQVCICLIKSTVRAVILWKIITIKKNRLQFYYILKF